MERDELGPIMGDLGLKRLDVFKDILKRSCVSKDIIIRVVL